MVNDTEPRYRLVDSGGTVVGTLYAQGDGTLALQEGTSGSDNEVTVATDGTLDAPAVSTEQIANGPIFAGNHDGADAEARLDSALSAANQSDIVVLEDVSYATRTISKSVEIFAPISGLEAESDIASGATWTLDSDVTLRGVDISGTVVANANESRLRDITLRGGALVDVQASGCTIMGVHGGGSITFASGTTDGEVGIITGTVRSNTTDNGTNNIL